MPLLAKGRQSCRKGQTVAIPGYKSGRFAGLDDEWMSENGSYPYHTINATSLEGKTNIIKNDAWSLKLGNTKLSIYTMRNPS